MSETRLPDDKPRILIAEGPWGIQEGDILYGGLGNVLGYGTVTGYDKVTHKCPWKKNWLMKTHTLITYYMKQETSIL